MSNFSDLVNGLVRIETQECLIFRQDFFLKPGSPTMSNTKIGMRKEKETTLYSLKAGAGATHSLCLVLTQF